MGINFRDSLNLTAIQPEKSIRVSQFPGKFLQSPFGGRVFYGEPGSYDQISTQTHELTDMTFGLHYVVADSSIDHLLKVSSTCKGVQPDISIADSLLAEESLSNFTRNDLPAFITQVKALPPDAIPPACAADLIAVAEAIIAQGE